MTKKLIVVGTFNSINASRFPYRHPTMSVLFTLTNGRGTCDLSLTVEHEPSGVEIAELRGPLALDNPLTIHEFDVTLKGIEFPSEGKYWVVLRADKRILGQRPFFTRVAGEQPARQNQEED